MEVARICGEWKRRIRHAYIYKTIVRKSMMVTDKNPGFEHSIESIRGWSYKNGEMKKSRHLIKPYITFPEAETCYKPLLVVASLIFALISPETYGFC